MPDSVTNTLKSNKMISVEEAERIILSQKTDYGKEEILLSESTGRVLAEELKADRDLPPFDRVSMDGIAIKFRSFEKGGRRFKINGTQAAGEAPLSIHEEDECIEIMTGAALPSSADTVVPYEDLEITDSIAIIQVQDLRKGQNIHQAGKDKKKGEIVAQANQIITPAIIGAAASTGRTKLAVKKLPGMVVISTGDELVDIDSTPSQYQIRRSNSDSIVAALKPYGIHADSIHLPDDLNIIKKEIKTCLDRYDVLLLTGGISMGKFDYVPKALEEVSVEKIFHKVQQRPGKPFWFGRYQNKLLFALPGNPVSSFFCLYRYVLPWLKNTLGLPSSNVYAVLNESFGFQPPLTYFMQVKLHSNEKGELIANPVKGNGSGDFSSLVEADGFMELPADRSVFKEGDVFRIWPLRNGL
jgi:molybdopterin molybdotransferase